MQPEDMERRLPCELLQEFAPLPPRSAEPGTYDWPRARYRSVNNAAVLIKLGCFVPRDIWGDLFRLLRLCLLKSVFQSFH